METGTVAKHNIKRVSRFVTNNHVNIAEGCRGLIRIAANSSGGCLVVAVDWVDIGRYKVLKAAVPIRGRARYRARRHVRRTNAPGRAVPILFAAYPKWRLKKSQNAFPAQVGAGLPSGALTRPARKPSSSCSQVFCPQGLGRSSLPTAASPGPSSSGSSGNSGSIT